MAKIFPVFIHDRVMNQQMEKLLPDELPKQLGRSVLAYWFDDGILLVRGPSQIHGYAGYVETPTGGDAVKWLEREGLQYGFRVIEIQAAGG